jgi:uncharacterized membrane protein YphA (DoxX/SURF4 family)
MPQEAHGRLEAAAGLPTAQSIILVILRVAIGWHFLYEGIVKLTDPNWTSAGYLAESEWIFSGFFHWIVENPALLKIVDLLNMWGLTLIGLALILGLFSRYAALAGVVLLALYYVANPPFVGLSSGMRTEGSYLIVDKNLVEMIALFVLFLFPTGKLVGLDRLLLLRRERAAAEPKPAAETSTEPEPVKLPSLPRRELIKTFATVPALGGFAFAVAKQRSWESWEEKNLLEAAAGVDTVSSATIKTFQYSSLKDLKGNLPYGKIGDLELTRMFLGGNLIGGWAHARDLIYVSRLVKEYHTDQKVFDTFQIAERCGINTILTNPVLCRVINDYWRKEKGKIQFISDCAYGDDLMTGIKMSIDGGAHSCYVQGAIGDRFAKEGKFDEIEGAIEFIRQNNLPAGIGAHELDTVKACVENGLKPDYWVKTLHHCKYWSARPEEKHNDNIWCTEPEETIAFMEGLEEPWIAFKVLAAGAIPPEEGFRYAFESGADFICVGMYDFQIVDDVNIAYDLFASDFRRNRPWRA